MYYRADRSYYRHDEKFFGERECTELPEPAGEYVSVGDNCTINVLMLCNGVMNCDECADEEIDTCTQFECPKGRSSVKPAVSRTR